MAYCACVLAMSNMKKTLRLTQCVLEECHFPSSTKGVFIQKELEEVAAWEEHRRGFLAKITIP